MLSIFSFFFVYFGNKNRISNQKKLIFPTRIPKSIITISDHILISLGEIVFVQECYNLEGTYDCICKVGFEKNIPQDIDQTDVLLESDLGLGLIL